jgi:Tfp pilus assembly protein PilV
MIAVGILAIGLVILLEAHVMNMRLVGYCGLRTRAVLLAEKKMAELESPSGERKGCFEGADSGFTWKELITPVVVGNQVLTGISRAEVVVSWDGGQREENVSLVTYVVR